VKRFVMSGCVSLWASVLAVMAAVLYQPSAAIAQGRTDVVSLANGDHITGEVVALERGQLEFKTDDAGTLYLEWEKLVSLLTPNRVVEVVTADGRRFVGTLGPAASRSIDVLTTDGPATLTMTETTTITPIGRSFWSKLDGSIDSGFSYTRSSGVAQLNLNSATVYRRPAFRARVDASLTLTQKEEDSDPDDRGSLEISYLRNPWQRWFITGAGRFETNESLGLEFRSQVGVAAGPRLINTNRAQMSAGAGLAFNHEVGVDVEPTDNVEGLLVFQTSYYTYDRPKTNLDVAFQYYPSLSNLGRQRVQFDAGVRRELLKDLFVALNGYDTFDSRPPNPDADKNDVGVVVSIGWSY
jgi:uncharacterized protein DUF481